MYFYSTYAFIRITKNKNKKNQKKDDGNIKRTLTPNSLSKYIPFVRAKKLQTLLSFSSAMRWDWTTTTPTEIRQIITVHVWKNLLLFLLRSGILMCWAHMISAYIGAGYVCAFFLNSSRRWLLMFSLCFFFDANYLNGTHRPQVSTGIFYKTHTHTQQQQHYESIYW